MLFMTEELLAHLHFVQFGIWLLDRFNEKMFAFFFDFLFFYVYVSAGHKTCAAVH
jgi:flagellar biogenesis protein FliO